MNTSENANPIKKKRADARAGADKGVHDAESPYPSTDSEQRLKAASAIMARVALRIAGGTTDGSAGNPSVPNRTEEVCGSSETAQATSPETTSTEGASLDPPVAPESAEETPPPSLSSLPGGRQYSADRAIDEGDNDMEVRAA